MRSALCSRRRAKAPLSAHSPSIALLHRHWFQRTIFATNQNVQTKQKQRSQLDSLDESRKTELAHMRRDAKHSSMRRRNRRARRKRSTALATRHLIAFAAVNRPSSELQRKKRNEFQMITLFSLLSLPRKQRCKADRLRLHHDSRFCCAKC